MKRSFYILFTLIMILILFPQSAFADEGKGSVNVTVSLPEGVTPGDGSWVNVALLKPAEVDANGFIQGYPEWIYSRSVYIYSDSVTVAFSNVTAGEYILYLNPYVNSADVLNESMYYSADGSKAQSRYTAVPFSLSSGETYNCSIKMGTAQTTINGTVYVSQAVPENTTVDLFFISPNSIGNVRGSVTIPVGQMSAAFTVGLAEDRYTFELDYNGKWADCSIDYSLTNDYQKEMTFDLTEGPLQDIAINADDLFPWGGSNNATVTVTVRLPEPLTEAKEFNVMVGTVDDYWYSNQYYSARAGEQEFSVQLSVEKGKSYQFCYLDATSGDDYDNDWPGALYAVQNGVTTDQSKAQFYTVSEDATIVIQEQSWFAVTGTLGRNGFASGSCAAGYVIAEFEDGERFADRVVFDNAEQSCSFSIAVPQRYIGQSFTVITAPASGVLNIGIQTEAQKSYGSWVLSGNTSVGTISLEQLNYVSYSGTISLPDGMAAPAGGIAVRLRARNQNKSVSFGHLIIPGGMNSVSFTVNGEPGLTRAFEAEIYGSAQGIFTEASDTSGNTQNISLVFSREAIIRGTVYLPDGQSGALVGEVYVDADYNWSDCAISIPAGSDHANYVLSVPDQQSAYIGFRVRYTSGDRISTNDIYIGEDWNQSNRSSKVYVDGNKTGIDFHISRCKLLSGRILSLNNDEIQWDTVDLWMQLYFYEQNNNSWVYRFDVDMLSDGTWTAKIDESVQGEYQILLNYNQSRTNLLYGSYYYADGGSVTNKSNADLVMIGSEDLTDIDFYVETGYVITGRVLIPEEGYINTTPAYEWNRNMNVIFKSDAFDQYYYGSVTIDTHKKIWQYRVVLPKQPATYEFYVQGSSGLLDYYESNVYLSGNSNKVSFSVEGDTTAPDITLPLLMYQVNGHIVSTDGSPLEFDFSSNGALQLFVYEEASNQSIAQFQIKSLTDDSWSIMLPETLSDSYLLYIGFGSINNNLMDNWYYYSYGKAARYQQDATAISFNESDVLDLDFYVETGYVITGSIVVPEDGYINKTTSNTWEQSINLRFKNTDTGNSYSRSVGIQPSNKRWDYRIVLPKQNGNYEFYAEGRASLLNSYDTNVGITGKTDTLTLAVSGNTTAPDLRLPLLNRVISGQFVAEDGGSVDLDLSDGSVILTIYKGSSGYDTAGEFPVTVVDDGTWTVTVPDNLVGEYRLRMYFGNIQSNLLDNYYYYADGLAVTYTEDASALTLGDTDITSLSFYVKAGYVVTGSIVIPEDGYINRITSNNWDEYVSVIFKNLDTNNTYSTSVQIDPSSKQWHYRLIVSRESGNYKYYAEGDSYLTRYYDFNVCLNGKTNVETVTLSGNTEVAAVRFPLLNRVIGGQFVTEGGGSVNIDASSGSVTLTIYEGNSGYNTVGEFPVSIENGGTWTAIVPDNLSGDYRLRMYFNDVQSNLLDTTYFYAEDHSVTYLGDASVLTISDAELTDLAFYVTAGYIVTGSIVIPEEGYITETSTNNWYRNVYVRFRNVDTGNEYSTSVAIDPTSKRWDYRIVIPQQSGEYEYYAYGDSYTLQYYDTNVCLNGRTDTKTVTLSDNTAVDDLRFPLLARTISGQFVSADGDAVDVDIADGSVRLTLYQGSSGYNTVGEYPVTVTGGNVWSVTIPDNLIGEYRLYLYFSGVQSNLLPTSYYYAEGQATTNMSNASVIMLGDEDITGLAFYVTTGYVVTGNICIPEGGYINKIDQHYGNWSVSVQFFNQSSYSNYSTSVVIDPESNAWAYRVVLPKQPAEYQCYASGSSNMMDYYDTNVWLTGQTNTAIVTIDQSMAMNNLLFPLIKATITGTVSRPSDVSGYLYYNVYVKTENGTYNRSYEIYSDQSAAAYVITVPETDEAETYQLYYTASTNTLRNGPMYLKEDGSLTETQSEACDFAFTDTVHDFTLVPLYPCLEGHFYIPDSIPDGEYISVQVGVEYYNENNGYYDSATTSFSVQVASDLKTDIKGRYVEYSLRAQNLKVDQPFYVKFYANSNSLNNKWFYVDIDNYVSVQRGETPDYVYDGVNPAIVDLVAQTWDDGNHYIFESAHGLSFGSATYTYTFPGTCSSLTLHFTEMTTEQIRINNRYYYPSGGESYTISGNSVSITVYFSNNRYGFAVDEITPNNVTVDTPGIAAVYTETAGDSVITQLMNTNELEATVYTGDIEPGTVLIGQAVLYDADNQFIGVASAQPVTVASEKNIPLHFNFDEVSSETASVAVLFLDEDLAPLSEEYVTYY